jgi:hypothetical protein
VIQPSTKRAGELRAGAGRGALNPTDVLRNGAIVVPVLAHALCGCSPVRLVPVAVAASHVVGKGASGGLKRRIDR